MRLNTMAIPDIHAFVKQYFTANYCTVSEVDQHILQVELTEEMDKKIMNRPFYWHYIEATQGKGKAKTLFLGPHWEYKDPTIESIYFGSTRFQQILKDLTKEPSIVQMFETVETKDKQALHPWLFVNMKITYQSMQTKDEIFSLGLNLITGHITIHMMDHLLQTNLKPTISTLCYVLSPIITYDSGLKRLEKILDVYLEEQSHQWAVHSIQEMDNELQLLDHFYEGDHPDKEREIKAIQKRYKPTITFKYMSGGIVYLTPSFQKKEKH